MIYFQRLTYLLLKSLATSLEITATNLATVVVENVFFKQKSNHIFCKVTLFRAVIDHKSKKQARKLYVSKFQFIFYFAPSS